MTFPETLMPPPPTDGVREFLAFVGLTVGCFVFGVLTLGGLIYAMQ